MVEAELDEAEVCLTRVLLLSVQLPSNQSLIKLGVDTAHWVRSRRIDYLMLQRTLCFALPFCSFLLVSVLHLEG